MTKDEAIKMLIKEYPFNTCAVSMILDKFISLGLIKFEEEIKCWYQSENHIEWGTVQILEHDKELHLWIGGRHRYKLSVDDVW